MLSVVKLYVISFYTLVYWLYINKLVLEAYVLNPVYLYLLYCCGVLILGYTSTDNINLLHKEMNESPSFFVISLNDQNILN